MLHVTFLAHSGFLVEDGKRCYVFDYYKDPNNIVWQFSNLSRQLLSQRRCGKIYERFIGSFGRKI